MLWYLVAAVLVLIISLHRYRGLLVLPDRIKSMFPRLRSYAPVSTFAEQVDAGLSSSNFDIEANISDGDSRAGLDENGTLEVQAIMKRERVNFDQARLIRQNKLLAANGIDPSGMPLDSKAITRL